MTGVAISLRGLALRGAFDPIDAEIEPGSFTQVVGATGTGGPELLLTLAGRLRGYRGKGEVSGYPLDHPQVRRLMSVARVRGAIASDAHLRLQTLVSDAHPDPTDLAEAWATVGVQPDHRLRLEELSACDQLLVELALAMAGGARGIVLEGADAGLPPDDFEQVGAALKAVAESGRTVIASVAVPDTRADHLILLPDREHQPGPAEEAAG